MAYNFSSIFGTATTDDYAVGMLRQVVGCAVASLQSASGECAKSEIVSSVLTIFNVTVSILAGLILTYTLMRGLFSAANSGEADGNSIGISYLYIALGAILILPVKNGLSIGNMLILQIAIWSSAGGNAVLNQIPASTLSGGYGQVSTIPEDDPALRGMIAKAIRTRAMGYVCASRLNQIAGYYKEGASPIVAAQLTELNVQSQMMFQDENSLPAITNARYIQTFQDNIGWYSRSSAMCGYVIYTVSGDSDVAGSGAGTVDETSYGKMRAIVTKAVKEGTQASWTAIDKSARDIAQQVLDKHDDAAIKALIASGVMSGQAALLGAMRTAVANAKPSEFVAQFIAEAKAKGWSQAISWQRAALGMYQFFQNTVNTASLETKEPEAIASLLQPMSSMGILSFGAPKLTGSTWTTLASEYERDVGYLTTFDSTFAGYARPVPTSAPSEFAGTSAGVSSLFRSLMSYMVVVKGTKDGQWSDPLINLVYIGVGLVKTGLVFVGLGTAADAIGFFKGAVPVGELASALGGGASTIGWIFVGAGWVLGGILPLVPVLYFFAAVMSWLVLALEGLVAIPLWALMLFTPARGGAVASQAADGFKLMLGLLLRPLFIIIGMVLYMLVMYVAFNLFNTMFRAIFLLQMPIDGGVIVSALMGSAAVILYLIGATMIVTFSASLITELGDAALRLIQINTQSAWTSRFGAEASSATNPVGRMAGIAQTVGGGVSGSRQGALRGLRRIKDDAAGKRRDAGDAQK